LAGGAITFAAEAWARKVERDAAKSASRAEVEAAVLDWLVGLRIALQREIGDLESSLYSYSFDNPYVVPDDLPTDVHLYAFKALRASIDQSLSEETSIALAAVRLAIQRWFSDVGDEDRDRQIEHTQGVLKKVNSVVSSMSSDTAKRLSDDPGAHVLSRATDKGSKGSKGKTN
jgi:hypothetical protein